MAPPPRRDQDPNREPVGAEIARLLRKYSAANSVSIDAASRELVRRVETMDREASLPLQLSPMQRAVFFRHIKNGATRAAAAEDVGVPRQTMYSWIRRNPALRTTVEDAEAEAWRQAGSGGLPRPWKVTQELRAAMCELLRGGATRGEAARAAGVARDTFYRWLRRSPEFARAVEEAEAGAVAVRANAAAKRWEGRRVS